MLDIIIDTLIDSLKIIPFLFVAFLIIEFLEHKLDDKLRNCIEKSDKFGPLVGSSLGIIPQCGFSVLATNFYITRVISLGTLISIYLSTSDEMIPIMIGENIPIRMILGVLLIKFVCGLIFGLVIDMVIRNKKSKIKYDYHFCDDEHCDCEHSLFKSALKHTINILLFITIITFILNILFTYVGETIISKIFMKDTLYAPFLGSLIGLIPNCGSSVIITEMFLKGVINYGTCIAGLLTNSGVALLILFKTNKNIKENLFIMLTLYLIGVLAGIIIELLSIIL